MHMTGTESYGEFSFWSAFDGFLLSMDQKEKWVLQSASLSLESTGNESS